MQSFSTFHLLGVLFHLMSSAYGAPKEANRDRFFSSSESAGVGFSAVTGTKAFTVATALLAASAIPTAAGAQPGGTGSVQQMQSPDFLPGAHAWTPPPAPAYYKVPPSAFQQHVQENGVAPPPLVQENGVEPPPQPYVLIQRDCEFLQRYYEKCCRFLCLNITDNQCYDCSEEHGYRMPASSHSFSPFVLTGGTCSYLGYRQHDDWGYYKLNASTSQCYKSASAGGPSLSWAAAAGATASALTFGGPQVANNVESDDGETNHEESKHEENLPKTTQQRKASLNCSRKSARKAAGTL